MDFITGNSFKNLCKYSFDEAGFQIHPINNDYYFIKIDMLPDFIRNILPNIRNKFILITHNGDLPASWDSILDDDRLILWLAMNVCYIHPKLKSIPIGIANPRWPHGDIDILTKIINQNNPKTNILYANFDINTNVKERTNCLRYTQAKLASRKDFESYLIELSQSYFVLSPNGNGVDCHKHWESLHLRTIPIVTNSINMSFYQDMPFLIINSWADFPKLRLTPDLYRQVWGNFKPESLDINEFLKRYIQQLQAK